MSKALNRLIDYILDENEGLKKEIGRILGDKDDLRVTIKRLEDDNQRLNDILTVYSLGDGVAPAQLKLEENEDVDEALEADKPSELNEQNATRMWTKGNAPKEAWPILVAGFLHSSGAVTCPFCEFKSEQRRGRPQHMSRAHPDQYAEYRVSPQNTAPGG